MYKKAGEKEFLKSYIVLLSCHLTLANMHRLLSPFGWPYWCSSAQPSKGQCTISKILSSPILSLFIEQNIYFQKCILPKILEIDFVRGETWAQHILKTE